MSNKIHVVHVAAGLWTFTGGPAEVIPNLCSSLVKEGCEITLISVDGPHSESVYSSVKNGVNFISFPVRTNLPIRYTPNLSNFLNDNIQDFDIVHNHGHWLYPNWCSFLNAKKHSKPLVTTPHGTLVPGMLSKSTVKKRIAWNFFDKKLLNYASVIHALSEAESSSMLPVLGSLSKKVRVVPNGAENWDLSNSGPFAQLSSKFLNKKILLFLSRVNRIKGICDLLDVWHELSGDFKDWHLLIVGPIDDDVKSIVSEYEPDADVDSSVTFLGPIYGSDRINLFLSADVFVLPSYAEGLPTALLEAMASRLPIVCTNECNFPEAENAGAALSGPAGKSTLVKNLRSLLSLTVIERKTMGNKGFDLFKKRFTWDIIASQWMSIYRSILR
jgi:poly(glycerol-phosphate) alpha-glucosyltransferase